MKTHWKLKFYSIWIGQAISLLTSSVLQMALIWHLTHITGSAAVLSMASIAGFLPTAVLGLFAGAMVDRWNRKYTMITADLLIAAVSLVLAIYALFATVPVWLILVILFVRSILTAFHSPALGAITPLLVPETELTRCAGYTQSLQTVGFILGMVIAAALYPIVSMSFLVFLDVGGAVLASLLVIPVAIPKLEKPATTETPHILSEMKAGYAIISKDKTLFYLLWIGGVFMFFYSPVNALFPLMSMEYFGGTTLHSSISEIAFAIGMMLGGVALGISGGFRNRGAGIIAALFIMGAAVGLSGLLPPNGFVAFGVLCVLMGTAVPFYTGPQTALMQERIAPQYLGRAFGLYSSVMAFSMPFGLVLSGLFADKIGVETWFFISGLGCMALGGLALCVPAIRNTEGKK